MSESSERGKEPEKLSALLSSDSEKRAALFSKFTDDERKAFVYQYHTLPALMRLDLNAKLPPAPFPAPEMDRLLKSAAEKYWSLWIDWVL